MSQQVKPVPEGQHTVTPYLIVRDAPAAIDFYRRALGAVEICRMPDPQSGRVMHAAVQIGDSRVMLADENPDWGALGPQSLGGSPVTIHLSVEDADATVARAAEAGATVVLPVAETFWGDRYGRLVDPFGHHWSVATHVVDLTPEQVTERMHEAFAAAASS